jgi:hypothetical protein
MAQTGIGRLPELEDFPVEQRNPAVALLLEICHRQEHEIVMLREQVEAQAEQIQLLREQNALQAEEIARLKDEIAILKGEKGRPNIKPSSLNRDNNSSAESGSQQKRGKPSCKKTRGLKIHHERVIEPAELPPGSKFKGYERFVVQDIGISLSNTRYLRARYETPDGKSVIGELPADVSGGHFGATLRSYVLSQYYQQHVPQNLILQQVREFGVRISAGELNSIITEGKDAFHAEKDEVLRAGLEVSSHISVDDTGARHQGKNGYCTHIGNEFFAWFSSTGSKSRINFLELLRAGVTEYVIDAAARAYMREQRLPTVQLSLLKDDQAFPDKGAWEAHLKALAFSERCRRIATEGALVGRLLKHGHFAHLVIMSDAAGQFNVAGFLNALCWVHAERTINTIIPYTDDNRTAQELARDQIWRFYQDLKAYKAAPTESMKNALSRRFDEIFTHQTCFQTLNLALSRIHKNKKELLLVLERPEIPLHNNLSENDIRDYVKKRKISATTRSDAGRKARDTMLSLKKTCRKLEISFWHYLRDRLSGTNKIPPLPTLIRATASGP